MWCNSTSPSETRVKMYGDARSYLVELSITKIRDLCEKIENPFEHHVEEEEIHDKERHDNPEKIG